tara:strand:+ start:40 stop:381 length:342 start_codon:yes stop_codon:yes gene_type:complete
MDNDKLIQKLLSNYKKKREYDYQIYHTQKKLDPIFMDKNRERAIKHYHDNKDKRKEYYEKNKDLHKCKNLYYYYKKNDRLDEFKSKYEDKYNILVSMDFIKLEQPVLDHLELS